MSTFIVAAAIMAAFAAGVIAWPLLRNGESRVQAALAAVIVAAAAAGLYPLWSNWDWHTPAQPAAGPDVAAMVAKLEKRLRDQPNDARGWLMLGRSYLALERIDDAVLAYHHALDLDGASADAALGLAEAMSLKAGGEITPEAGQLFEKALSLAPANPKALLYGGFAAAARGDRSLARTRWETLKEFHPPAAVVQMLDERIAELGQVGTSSSPPGTSTSSGDLKASLVTVNITLAPDLKTKLKAEVPLFVFAREPGSQGPPLAAKRLTTSAIGTQVQLSSADSMMPGHVLAGGQRVTITARVSFSGQPVPSHGDLYGEMSYEVGHGETGNLVIDRVAD